MKKTMTRLFLSFLLGGILLTPVTNIGATVASSVAAVAQSATNVLLINADLSGLRAGGQITIPYTISNPTAKAFVAVTPVGDLTAKVIPTSATSGNVIVTSTGKSVENLKILVSVCDEKGSSTFAVDKDGITGDASSDEYPVTIAGAELEETPMATPTSNFTDEGGVVSMNTNMIAGGSNMITITSPQELKEIQLGVDGQTGHYALDAATVVVDPVTRATSYVYGVDLNASLQVNVNITILIVVITKDGAAWGYERPIVIVPTGTGDLKVSLTFNNAKDVDLWVKEPNGNYIYYGNRQPALGSSNPRVGLDLDSNPGCHIDNINNENIFFDEDCLQKGTYEVYVDMYSNCDPTIATAWTVNAFYKGELLEVATGTNPASGVFSVDAPSNHGAIANLTPVMTFTIDEGQVVPALRSAGIPIEQHPTESAILKLRQSGLME